MIQGKFYLKENRNLKLKNSHKILCIACCGIVTNTYADVVITADTLRYDQKTKQSFAEGNAKIVDGEGHDQKVLTADNIEAHHDGDNRTESSVDLGGGAISRVTAKGSVKMITGDRTVTAGQCEYDTKTKKLTCTGNVDMKTPKEHLTGDKGTADMTTNIYTIEKDPLSKTQSHAVVQTDRP
jgi:lipopolysaccharide assembly outer membrane protein LptD (OstA)